MVEFSKEKIKWFFTKPGYNVNYFLMIVNKESKEVVGSIMCHKQTMVVDGQEVAVATTTYQAVHKNNREKKMAPTLVVELLRRTRADGIDVGLY